MSVLYDDKRRKWCYLVKYMAFVYS